MLLVVDESPQPRDRDSCQPVRRMAADRDDAGTPK
jgi:hypothetical protein